MNLKESFRYQGFLDTMLRRAIGTITLREHCLIVTKTHNRNKANSDAVDEVETVEVEKFFSNDAVIKFMELLVKEKELLTRKINEAKASIEDIDLDAAIESNKFRQQISTAIKVMLGHTPRKTTERGMDYKFNAEGNQTSYYYDIVVESTENYDRNAAKEITRYMITTADGTSTLIDAALINTQVDYEAKFDVNDNFEDVMEQFLAEFNN